MPISIVQIFRDFVIDGVPSSGKNKPKKTEIRTWGAWVESIISAFLADGGLVYETRADLFADLAKAYHQTAWVVQDATVAYNGIYMKVGGSGSGYWLRVADLPYSFIVATDAGAGAANAIKATTSIPVSESSLIVSNVFEVNTGSPVTISFNDGPNLTIKTNDGSDIAAGGLPPMLFGIIQGSTFRCINDVVSASIIAAAQAQANAAAASAAAAAASAAGVHLPSITAGDKGKTLSVKNDETGFELVASPAFSPGTLFGLTLSNNVTDAVNDLNISAGKCRDIDDTGNIVIASAITKRLDANWAVGNNAGGLDTGTKTAGTWYHVWAIRRPDTGVCDVLFSTSPTSPVMPANYTQKRRIGAIGVDGSLAILPFFQAGGWFHHIRPIVDLVNATGYIAPNLVPLTLPTGVKMRADLTVVPQVSAGGLISFVAICDPDTGTAEVYDVVANAYTNVNASQVQVYTNTAGKVSVGAFSNDCQISIYTRGWYDGRDTYI